MATSQSIVDYLLDQLADSDDVSAKKMFGEFCLYFSGKPVALVCDEQLFLKPTNSAKALITNPILGFPYPKAKPHLLIEADLWEDREWLAKLIRVTADELPAPKPQKKNT